MVMSMANDDIDKLLRFAAFEHVRKLGEIHDHLTANELKPGFFFQGQRIWFQAEATRLRLTAATASD